MKKPYVEFLKELDPPDLPITQEELRRNCGYPTKEEAAEAPPVRSEVVRKVYTWRERVTNLERLYDKLRPYQRSERELQESVDYYLGLMKKQGVDIGE